LPAVAAQSGHVETLNRTLQSLASSPGVTSGAHYADVANGTHVLVAALPAGAADPAVELVAAVADAEVYAATAPRP
jgi:hypothetical protein